MAEVLARWARAGGIAVTVFAVGANFVLADGLPILLVLPVMGTVLAVRGGRAHDAPAALTLAAVLVGVYGLLGLWTVGALFLAAAGLLGVAAVLYHRSARSATGGAGDPE